MSCKKIIGSKPLELTLLNPERRTFIIKSSLMIGASSAFFLPSSLKAAGNLFSEKVKPAILSNNIGFNGERRDSVTGGYHLGNGYRMFIPGLMRFNAPDSESPFSEGGLNPYVYCLGDPVNLVDPSGHISVGAAVGIGVGILGILISVFTLGLGIFAAATASAATAAAIASTGLSITSSALGIVSSATGIASSALEESDPQMSDTLGKVSLGFGIGSLLTGLGSASLSRVSTINQARSFSTEVSSTTGQFPQGKILGGIEVTGKRITVHGYPFNTLANFKGVGAVNGRQVGKFVNPYIGGIDEINFTSCFSAVGGKISSAQLLANQTGKAVRGATRYAVAANAGSDLSKTFYPMTGAGKLTSNLAGGVASHFVRSSIRNSGIIYRLPLLFGQNIINLSM